jgi:hypothetical protein
MNRIRGENNRITNTVHTGEFKEQRRMRNRISSANFLFEDIQQEAVREKGIEKTGYINSNVININ